MWMYVYVSVYMYMYIYIYVYVHICYYVVLYIRKDFLEVLTKLRT